MKGTALITGAAGGIGYSFVELCARDKLDLVLVDLAPNIAQVGKQIESKYGVKVVTIQKDLTAPNAPQEIFDELVSQNVHVDYLFNNAGFGDFGRFIDIPLARETKLCELNMVVLMQMTHIFANDMAKRHGGKIINMSSIASFAPGPYMPLYYSTKAFVTSFSESVNYELKGTGVSVTAYCPGPTNTGFEKNAGMKNSLMFTFSKSKTPMETAKAGYKAMMKGKTFYTPTLMDKGYYFLTKLAPRKWVLALTRKINIGNRKAADMIKK